MLRQLQADYECAVLSGKVQDTRSRHGVEAHPHFPFGVRSFFRFDWLSSFSALKSASLVVLGGGGLFTDSDSSKAVYLWSWHVFWTRLFRKPVVLFANSVGPLEGRFNRFLAKRVFKSCEKLIVRDALSKKELEKMGFTKVQLGFDPVILFAPVQKNKGGKKIAVNFRPIQQNFKHEAALLKLKESGYELVFVATEPADAALMSKWGKVVLPKDFSELVSLLNQCEYGVGMRLHFLIAGVLAGCKIHGISYNLKVAGLLKALDLPFSELADDLEWKEARTAKDLAPALAQAEEMFEALRSYSK